MIVLRMHQNELGGPAFALHSMNQMNDNASNRYHNIQRLALANANELPHLGIVQ